MHVFETTLREEPKSRERLVNTMVEISNAYSIKSFIDVQKDELLNAFFKIFAPEKVKSIEAIVKNPLIPIGAEEFYIDIKNNTITKEIKQELINIVKKNFKRIIDDKEILNMILNNHNKELTKDLISGDEEIVEQLKKDRINLLNLPKENMYNIFLIKRFWEIATKICKINIQELFSMNDLESICKDKDKLINMLEDAPSVNVTTKLTYQLLKDRERSIQKHDDRDITFLSTAIPYCDVVITEKTWVHLIKLEKLDKKYSTIVKKDLNYLLEI